MKNNQKEIDGKVYDNETDMWVEPADLTPTSDNPDPAGYGDGTPRLDEITDEELKLAKEAIESESTDIEEAEDTEEMDEMEEFEPTQEEKDEMNNPSDSDPEYLEYSSEAVGYENREQQWDTYRTVANYLGEGDSVIDFGCARGDFERFFEQEFNESLDYTGVDMNQQLIDAGKKVYNEEVELICQDWFTLDKELTADWAINIGSSNLRYDADTVRNDMEYLQDTISAMMKHSEKGCVLLLASDLTQIDDGLINWNAGEVFNWAQKEFGGVALDHTFSDDIFTIIIYKNQKYGIR